MSSDSTKKNEFLFFDEEDRPYVAQTEDSPEYHVRDKVYVLKSDGSREGPYIVKSVPSAQKCTLSLENGQTAKNGEEVEMAKLQAA